MLLPRLFRRARVPRESDYCIKAGYHIRELPEYFLDAVTTETGTVYQPDVYPFAAALAERYGCDFLVDIGCGRAEKLTPLGNRFSLVGVDFGDNFAWARTHAGLGETIEWDLERDAAIPLDPAVAARSVVICADVIEHLVDPLPLVKNLRSLAGTAAAVIVSTPERDLARGVDDPGPPQNVAHVREWTLPELSRFFTSNAAPVLFSGLTRSTNKEVYKNTSLLVLDGAVAHGPPGSVPANFDVLAVICAYNEEDIIVPVVRKLLDEGIRVRLIDNWSTDATVERCEALRAGDRMVIERFPVEGPAEVYDWRGLLGRVEEINEIERADWILHHDADEIRRSPWPGVNMREALWHVDRLGFSAVDHTVLEFWPTDARAYAGQDPERHFGFGSFGAYASHFVQIRAWRRAPSVELVSSGGHQATFPGRRVFPYKFLLKHYPLRSVEQARRKVLVDRQPRWSPAERASGWHVQYDDYDVTSSFLSQADQLLAYDAESFSRDFLVERLTGINVPRR